MDIENDVFYIGVNDHNIDLFEGQYAVPNGMSYNSYIVIDEKIAVFDTIEAHFKDEWLNNIEKCLNGKTPDYLIVQHMEPDHSANILAFAEKYPQAKIIGNSKTFNMISNFFGTDFNDRRIVVNDGETLSTGRHVFTFVFAPMVHWPEVMMTYDCTDKLFFSADAFGKFGALDFEDDWINEARRYYIGIVAKYGAQVQNVLKKASELEIRKILPLHGPVLDNNLDYYLNLYNIWSSYQPETEGVLIAYTSIYGNTRKAAELLGETLLKNGCKEVNVIDLARYDISKAVSEAFKYSKLVLASVTYNTQLFPQMLDFINHLTQRNYQNRTIGIIENGSWAPTSGKSMVKMLETCKNITFTETTVKIKSALNDESMAQIDALAKELIN